MSHEDLPKPEPGSEPERSLSMDNAEDQLMLLRARMAALGFGSPGAEIPTFYRVTTSLEYADAFHSGRRVEIPADSALRGRIMRGKEPEDFERLGSGPRKLAFTMGPDGLELLPGLPVLGALSRIGLMPEYVQGRIKQGYTYKLIVFEGGDAAPLATWGNALNLAAEYHPEIREDIERHRDTLASIPFSTLAQHLGSLDLNQVDLAGPQHPEFMNFERYLALPEERRRTDVLALRRVLMHEVHLNTLFAGDGRTTESDGSRGMLEYLAPNVPISELNNPVLIDLDIPGVDNTKTA